MQNKNSYCCVFEEHVKKALDVLLSSNTLQVTVSVWFYNGDPQLNFLLNNILSEDLGQK